MIDFGFWGCDLQSKIENQQSQINTPVPPEACGPTDVYP